MRVGIIQVSDLVWDTQRFREFFESQFIVISISEDFKYSCKLVKCKSEWFREVEEMELIPWYDIEVSEDENEKLYIESVREVASPSTFMLN